ncbi:HAD hydrolase-like protein [bacterium]|nr:HAD hydrolase-like protein [bacterium]
MNLFSFDTILFDCDGVILNSNKIKTDAFAESVRHYGKPSMEALVKYHVSNGGVSRYKKFDYFIEQILPKYRPDFPSPAKSILSQQLLSSYSSHLELSLSQCEVASSLDSLRLATNSSKWFIVSGGDQSELRHLFNNRNLNYFFDGGIFGSPASKYEIITMLINQREIGSNSLFVGDSKLDYEVSSFFNLPFVFIRQWSEFKEIDIFASEHLVPIVDKVSDLASISF